MDEKQAVLAAWNEIAERNEAAVLATVVEVEGSSYRRPGARMLITRTGERVGSISGGCLETDVCQKAWWWTETGPHVQTYDTLTDEEAAQEFGLGCNGVVRVLLQRVGGKEKHADALRQFLTDTQSGVLAGGAAALLIQIPRGGETDASLGDCFLWPVEETGGTVQAARVQAARVQAALTPIAHAAVAACKSRTVSCALENGESMTAFVECVSPPQPLVVFGGGHDVVPLVRLAKTLGWHVSVVESRPAFARHDRFPEADTVLCHPADALPFTLDPNAAALLMNHRYGEDCALLKQLLALPNPPMYVGVLGPRTRAEKILRELNWPANTPWPAFLHAPVGLDIGADAPETIALSILAEVQAHLRNRNGGKLRERSGPINERQA